MTKILFQYAALKFVVPFLASTLFFVMFLLIFQFFSIIDIVINKGVSVVEVAEICGHILISFLPMAIPLSLFFATFFALNKLNNDAEIIAMRSFGLSKIKILMPFLAIGTLVGCSLLSLNQSLIPYSARTFKNTMIRLSSQGMLSAVKPGQFYTEVPGVILFAKDVDSKSGELYDVFISPLNSPSKKMIMAKRGRIVKEVANEWSLPLVRLILFEGNILTYSTEGKTEKTLFLEYDFPLTSSSGAPGFVDREGMRSSKQLWDDIKPIYQKPKKEQGDEVHDLSRIEFWVRITAPLLCLLFITFAYTLSIRNVRAGGGKPVVQGILFLILYYALYFAGIGSVARKHSFLPELVVFIPLLLCCTWTSFNFYRMDWK
jgi:lipopolysaccharide export system permease protein